METLKHETIKRWDNYITGIKNNFGVRKNELNLMLDLVNPNSDDKILEIGAGSGYLTFPIARQLNKGKLIAADINQNFINRINEFKNDLSLETYLYDSDYTIFDKFPYSFKNKFNKIISLATFHHFDTKGDLNSNGSNTYDFCRTSILEECYTMLKDGGSIIIGDIINNTNTQKYFDELDNPLYLSPTGHPHNFFSKSEFYNKLKNIGYKNISVDILEVPWKFNDIEHTKNFLNTIHNAKCSLDESLEVAKKHLNLKNSFGKIQLEWQLGFIKATK